MVKFQGGSRKVPETSRVRTRLHSLSLGQKNQKLVQSKNILEQKTDRLIEELRLALYRKYGRASEKLDPNQQGPFSEIESEDIIVSYHRCKKAGRKSP